jgi:flagellar motor switch protein FliM
MSRILSQDEIDALITSAEGLAGRSQTADSIFPYNFRRPDRIQKEQIRSLHFLHDRFARNATTSLSAFLRTTVELSIMSVEQFSYSEFLMALPDPTAFYAVTMPPFEALGALELNPAVAFAMIDRMLGGAGQSAAPQRALTDIEQNVVDSVVKILLDHLTEMWRSVTEIRFQIQARETRPQMLQVASWNEVVILLVFDLKVAETRGLLHICIPSSVIEAVASSFGQSRQRTRRDPTPVEKRWLIENLGRVLLPVTSGLDASLRTRELLKLKPGQVLNLGVPVESDVDVRVGEFVKFQGRLVTSASRAAVRLTHTCLEPLEGSHEAGE